MRDRRKLHVFVNIQIGFRRNERQVILEKITAKKRLFLTRQINQRLNRHQPIDRRRMDIFRPKRL